MLTDTLLGTLLGFIAGLIPGIHSNTFASLTLLYSPSFQNPSAIIVSSAIAYTIANIIPTVFLGVPDEDTAIAVHPANEMVLEGRGFEAVSISAIASFLAIILSFLLYPAIYLLGLSYSAIRRFTPLALLAISAFLILTERGEEFGGSYSAWRKRLYAFLVFAVSGFIGFVTFQVSEYVYNPAGSMFLPLLTGLFGVPILLQTTSGSVPPQEVRLRMPGSNAVSAGTIAGFLVSLFPGVSSGVATVLATVGIRDREGYVAAVSAANSANAVLCFFMLIATSKTRSGAADALLSLGVHPPFFELIFMVTVSASIALPLTLFVSRLALSRLTRLRFSKLSAAVLLFLIALTYTLTGFVGLMVLFVSSIVGMSAPLLGVRRANCMGCLIIPVLLYYLPPS
jgi:putative membrane protein